MILQLCGTFYRLVIPDATQQLVTNTLLQATNKALEDEVRMLSFNFGNPTSPAMRRRGRNTYRIHSDFLSALQRQYEWDKSTDQVVNRTAAASTRSSRSHPAPTYAGLVAMKEHLLRENADEQASEEEFTSAAAFGNQGASTQRGGTPLDAPSPAEDTLKRQREVSPKPAKRARFDTRNEAR